MDDAKSTKQIINEIITQRLFKEVIEVCVTPRYVTISFFLITIKHYSHSFSHLLLFLLIAVVVRFKLHRNSVTYSYRGAFLNF